MSNLNQSLLSELTTGIVILDTSLRIKFINSSALGILDTTERNCIGQEIDQVFFENLESVTNFTEALESKRSFTKTDAILNLKRGRKVLCTYIVHPLSDENGPGLLLELINKEASSELIERYRMRANQQISQDFVRGLAHEIKNPLSGIRGSAQLLSNKLTNQNLKEYTDIVIKQTDRLTSLVDNILGPNEKPDFKFQNIHYPIENVLNLIDNESDYKGITITKDFDPSIPDLLIDSYLIENSILNLVKNAKESLKDANTDNPEINIVTRVSHGEIIDGERNSTVCKISIIDNGPGIEEEIKDSIFFPMITGKDKGTGLGLSITQGIISQHKGNIHFTSEPDKTEFYLNIPINVNKELDLKIANG